MKNITAITKIVNVNTDVFDVYIGRPSKWGNPFKIGKDGSRTEVIRKYKEWLLENEELLKDILELDGKVLGCHCKPKKCHGDIIIETIRAMKNYSFDV